jgi:outer membrane protein OmpA-like peptidoglycan-associated protein
MPVAVVGAAAVAAAAAVVFGGGRLARAADLPDSKDFPLLKRFAGSEIVGYDVKRFDSYDLQTSTFKQVNLATHKREFAKPPLHIEGGVTRIWYESAGDTSSTELAHNYRNELKAKGFDILYDSAEDTAAKGFNGYFIPIGDESVRNNRAGYVFSAANQRTTHVISAKLARSEGDVYAWVATVQWDSANVTFRAKRGAYAAVYVIETRPMTQNMVSVSADEMGRAIASTGRVALYGIYFDTGKAEILPSSKAALDEVAKLLRREVNLKLRVVGHTDGAGSMEANLSLSQRRAEAVSARLSKEYGIDSHRLSSHGVSSLAPAAPNTSEEGRAKNRRVELVPW